MSNPEDVLEDETKVENEDDNLTGLIVGLLVSFGVLISLVGIFLYARYGAPGITTRARNSIRHNSLAPRNIYTPARRATHTRLVSESESLAPLAREESPASDISEPGEVFP